MNLESIQYDLAIIGGGPGGVSGGIYAARKRLKTVFITESWGGQSTVSDEIQNWVGTIAISGQKLADDLKAHLKHYAGESLSIQDNTRVKSVEKIEGGFSIQTNKNTFTAKTILITTGSHRRKLDILGAKEFENRGITYCATCDAPLFGDMDVVVIGGGNAAFESAIQLTAYAKSVTLLNRGEDFRADSVTVEKALKNPRFRAILNAVPKEIKGEKFVSSIIYTNKETDQDIELPVSGVFVEIGLLPSTDAFEKIVELNQFKQIITDPRTQQTKTQGIWAAGDCTDGYYHQNNIAAGDAVKALEDIYIYLHKNS
ncbi:MAG: FAD-dependent oxidoreductase [Candidatus Paceibacterota bacterium]|jgi:alkyl hydroperoxide reductase subunit F